jgi:hypothetical protein
MEKDNINNDKLPGVISGKMTTQKSNKDEIYADLIKQSLLKRQNEIDIEMRNLTHEKFEKIQNKLIQEGILKSEKENIKKNSLLNLIIEIFTKPQINNAASLGVGIVISASLIILYIVFPRFENNINGINDTKDINYQRDSKTNNQNQEEYEEIIKLEPLKIDLKNKNIDFKVNQFAEGHYELIFINNKVSKEILDKYDIKEKQENGAFKINFK